jgi:hypothetical protein
MIDAGFREEMARKREKVDDLFIYEGNEVFYYFFANP